MDKLPIYKLVIDEAKETGVDYVAMVDNPAIEINWHAFSDQRILFKITSSEKRIISGPLMVADLPIYRRDEQYGEYYAVFDAPTILQITQRYFKNQYTSNVNKMHDPNQKVEGVFMFESFIIDRSRGVNPPTGFEGLTDGSWFGSYKVDNDQIWEEEVKTGKFKGFSVEGIFKQEPYAEAPQDTIDQIIEAVNAI